MTMNISKHTNTVKYFLNTSLPNDWKVENVANITIDHKQGYYTKEEYSANGKYFLIRGKDLQSPDIKWENSPKVNATDDDYNLYKVEIGDFLFVRSGNIGEYGVVVNEIPPSIFASYLIRFKLNQNLISNSFFGAFYSSNLCIDQLKKITQGSSNININANNIKSLKLPLPPLAEQYKIAKLLDAWGKAIYKTLELIALKELHKKWLIHNLLSGKMRLNGFGGEWKKLGAGEIFKSCTNKGFDDEELLSATQDRGVIPRNMLNGRVTMPDGTTAGYKLVEPGDFIISLRSFQGGLEYSYYRGLVSPAYIVLKPKKKINDEFYKQYYKSHEFIGRLATAVIGIRDGKQISYDDFCIVKIPFPSFEEQTAIAQVLHAADREILLLKTKTEKIREQKKGMMQVLLTGKKRLINTIDAT